MGLGQKYNEIRAAGRQVSSCLAELSLRVHRALTRELAQVSDLQESIEGGASIKANDMWSSAQTARLTSPIMCENRARAHSFLSPSGIVQIT